MPSPRRRTPAKLDDIFGSDDVSSTNRSTPFLTATPRPNSPQSPSPFSGLVPVTPGSHIPTISPLRLNNPWSNPDTSSPTPNRTVPNPTSTSLIAIEPLTPRKPSPIKTARQHVQFYDFSSNESPETDNDSNSRSDPASIVLRNLSSETSRPSMFRHLPPRPDAPEPQEPRSAFSDSEETTSSDERRTRRPGRERPVKTTSLGRSLEIQSAPDILSSSSPDSSSSLLPIRRRRRQLLDPVKVTISRTSQEPLYPGSHFPIQIDLITSAQHCATTDGTTPRIVTVTFSCIASSSSSSSNIDGVTQKQQQRHTIFHLSSTINLNDTSTTSTTTSNPKKKTIRSWNGTITIPIGSNCLSCGKLVDPLPWSFSHNIVQEEAGGTERQSWEMGYEIVAKCQGYEDEEEGGEGRLEIEVGTKLIVPRCRQEEGPVERSTMTIEGEMEGWRLDEENSKISCRTTTNPDPTTQGNSKFLLPSDPISFIVSTTLQFVPSSISLLLTTPSSTSLDLLSQSISSNRSIATIEAILRNSTGGTKIAQHEIGQHNRSSNEYVKISFETLQGDLQGQEGFVVEVKREWRFDSTRAVVLARMESCLGFQIDHILTIHLDPTPSSSSRGTIRVKVPFRPHHTIVEEQSPLSPSKNDNVVSAKEEEAIEPSHRRREDMERLNGQSEPTVEISPSPEPAQNDNSITEEEGGGFVEAKTSTIDHHDDSRRGVETMRERIQESGWTKLKRVLSLKSRKYSR